MRDHSSCPAREGGRFVGDDDDGRLDLVHELHEWIAAWPEISLKTPGDVGDIADPLAQPEVAFPRAQLAQLGDGALERPVGIDALEPDQLVGATREERVVEHEQLSREDGGLRRADRPRDARRDLLELAPGALAGGPKPLPFAVDAACGQPVPHLAGLAHRDHGAADGHAGGDSAPLESRHTSSNPRSIRPQSAATASPASSPSAVICSMTPRAAASISSPRMLLPSTRRSPRATSIVLRYRTAVRTN